MLDKTVIAMAAAVAHSLLLDKLYAVKTPL
jgi:hypothetical protein